VPGGAPHLAPEQALVQPGSVQRTTRCPLPPGASIALAHFYAHLVARDDEAAARTFAALASMEHHGPGQDASEGQEAGQ